MGGGAAWAADRYLIPKVEVADVAAYEAAAGTSASAAAAGLGEEETIASLTADSYTRGSTSVQISKASVGSGDDTVTYYVAEVELGEASELRSAFANNQFGENIIEKPSEIAADNGAVFAVNGDYYGFRDTGIVIRNGVVYRDEGARDGLAFYADGSVEVYDETTTSAETLLAAGVWNTLSFGPALVENGVVVAGIDEVEVDTSFGNHSIQGTQPRTAVGVIDENHLVFVVVDGREKGYSRFGNEVARALFRLAAGWRLSDTQTGLRGFSYAMLPWLIEVPGERFEYEQRVLLGLRRAGFEARERGISTVYLHDNASSHFRPVLDSLRVTLPVLLFAASSLVGFAIDTLLLALFYDVSGALVPSIIGARLLSGSANFWLNRRLVFMRRGREGLAHQALGYALLATLLLASNVVWMSYLTGIGVPLWLAKVATEIVLFFTAYGVQRGAVFGQSGERAVGVPGSHAAPRPFIDSA